MSLFPDEAEERANQLQEKINYLRHKESEVFVERKILAKIYIICWVVVKSKVHRNDLMDQE